MARQSLVMALGKVMVAAAWADGKVSHEEVNSLKDLMFHLPNMTAADWAELEIYIHAPIDDAERERLIVDLQNAIITPGDKALAKQALDELMRADGIIADDERAVVNDIKAAIESGSGVLNAMKRFMTGAVDKRMQAVANAPNREHQLEDFVRNRVYYSLQKRGFDHINLPDDQLRKLSLAGGLMARVAHVDRDITENEIKTMAAALQDRWHLNEEQAMLVAEVAVSEITPDLDYYRLTREFFEVCNHDELAEFLEVLFQVAAADGVATVNEIEEIRSISKGLILAHEDFINAKLTLPREKREA